MRDSWGVILTNPLGIRQCVNALLNTGVVCQSIDGGRKRTRSRAPKQARHRWESFVTVSEPGARTCGSRAPAQEHQRRQCGIEVTSAQEGARRSAEHNRQAIAKLAELDKARVEKGRKRPVKPNLVRALHGYCPRSCRPGPDSATGLLIHFSHIPVGSGPGQSIPDGCPHCPPSSWLRGLWRCRRTVRSARSARLVRRSGGRPGR